MTSFSRIARILSAAAVVLLLVANLIGELSGDPPTRPPEGKPGTVKDAVEAAGDADNARVTFQPDPETGGTPKSAGPPELLADDDPPTTSTAGGLERPTLFIRLSTTAFANGRLPATMLSPILGGKLARGPPAAGWNTMQLYRFVRNLPPVQTNGPASSYRTIPQQIALRNYWCAQGKCGNAASPGYSVHGVGNAVDNNEFAWLRRNARPFCWDDSNAPWEGWHSSRRPACRFGRPDPGPNRRYPVLRVGSGGPGQAPFVKFLERDLRFKRPDGEYRANTARAVRAAERRCGFRRPDGVTTRATWAHSRKRGPICPRRRR